MKIAIFTLLMGDEFESSRTSLRSIIKQLSKDKQLFLLLNGAEVPDIANHFQNFPFVNFFSSQINLGVAGGRNFLISKIVDWDADLFISLDNDILVPKNYIDSVVLVHGSLVSSNPNKKIGILSPLIAQASECKQFIQKHDLISRSEFPNDEFYFYLNNEVEPHKKSSKIYHMGIRNWKKHYIYSLDKLLIFIIGFLNRIFKRMGFDGATKRLNICKSNLSTFLKDDQFAIDKFLNSIESFEVDNLPGGLHIFNKKFLTAVGNYDERFNPFGYEDADLCIRAKRMGYSNYIFTSVIVLHDLDSRYVERNFSYNMRLRGKSKNILIRKHIVSTVEKLVAWSDAFMLHPFVILVQCYKRRSNIQETISSLEEYFIGLVKGS